MARGSRPRETLAQRRARRAAVDDIDEVLDSAARILETRSRSMAEVRRRLLMAGYQAALVEAAVERLTEQGYLDDEQFARAWVESRDRARPRGERALRLELTQKGVAREIVDTVLAKRAGRLEPLEADALQAGRSDAVASTELDDAAGVEETAGVEEAAATRLLERHRRSLLREPDPARLRQKAYALLARNGFDPDVCRTIAYAFVSAAILTDDSGRPVT